MTRIDSTERAQLLNIARLVAGEAAELVSAGFRSRPRALEKGQFDLVTEFDRASEALLVSRLPSLAPEIPVVGEESTEGIAPSRPGLVWYVDPLDGTTNFVHGHPFWAVAVGLAEDDQPVLGAIVAPALGLTWTGYVGAADERGVATRNGHPCATSPTATLAESMLATGFPANRNQPPEDNFGSFVAVKRRAQAVRRCGSAAIDLCFVADGTYDGYWERKLRTWDTMGAGAIVIAAGGRISSIEGGAPNYHVGRVVASNGRIHDELVAAIAAGAEARL